MEKIDKIIYINMEARADRRTALLQEFDRVGFTEEKIIRFGQQGVIGSPSGTKRNKAFKARHASNIAKGKMSAAYWANKVKW